MIHQHAFHTVIPCARNPFHFISIYTGIAAVDPTLLRTMIILPTIKHTYRSLTNPQNCIIHSLRRLPSPSHCLPEYQSSNFILFLILFTVFDKTKKIKKEGCCVVLSFITAHEVVTIIFSLIFIHTFVYTRYAVLHLKDIALL